MCFYVNLEIRHNQIEMRVSVMSQLHYLYLSFRYALWSWHAVEFTEIIGVSRLTVEVYYRKGEWLKRGDVLPPSPHLVVTI